MIRFKVSMQALAAAMILIAATTTRITTTAAAATQQKQYKFSCTDFMKSLHHIHKAANLPSSHLQSSTITTSNNDNVRGDDGDDTTNDSIDRMMCQQLMSIIGKNRPNAVPSIINLGKFYESNEKRSASSIRKTEVVPNYHYLASVESKKLLLPPATSLVGKNSNNNNNNNKKRRSLLQQQQQRSLIDIPTATSGDEGSVGSLSAGTTTLGSVTLQASFESTPSSSSALAEVGNDGSCDDGSDCFPLGECLGDCDDDDECAGDLKCFQRSGTEAVPGCSGTGDSGKDYCYNDTPTPTTASPTKTPTAGGGAASKVLEESDVFPLGECQGDCDENDDCAGLLVCLQRSGDEPVPGCSGEGTSKRDYCYFPPNILTDIDDEPNDKEYPLGWCQGDCDDDSECKGDLKCFQRDDQESVPNCSGTGTSKWDYCYTDTTNSPTNAPTLSSKNGDDPPKGAVEQQQQVPIQLCTDPEFDQEECPHLPCVAPYLDPEDEDTYAEFTPGYGIGSLAQVLETDEYWNGNPQDRPEGDQVGSLLVQSITALGAASTNEYVCEPIEDNIWNKCTAPIDFPVPIPNPFKIACHKVLAGLESTSLAMTYLLDVAGTQAGVTNGAEIEAGYEHTKNLLQKQCAIFDQAVCRCVIDEHLESYGLGCDGKDSNCNDLVDECDEDQVPPTIDISDSTCSCSGGWFADKDEAISCVENTVFATDDCQNTTVEVSASGQCANGVVSVTAKDDCNNEATSAEVPVQIDGVAPEVSCGFDFGNETMSPYISVETTGPRVLLDTKLSYTATDNCGGPLNVTVKVYSNEIEDFNAQKIALLYKSAGKLNDAAGLYVAQGICSTTSNGQCVDEATFSDQRLYTVEVIAVDKTGLSNRTECYVEIRPKGEGRKFPDISESKQRFLLGSYFSIFDEYDE